MADLLGTLRQVVEFGFQIKAALEEAGHNAERCRGIGDLLRRLGAVAEDLEVEGDDKMRGAAAGLEEARRRAAGLVARCRDKGLLRRAWEAKDIDDDLRWVCLDLLLNLAVVLLANGASNASMLAEIRADIAENASMLARILEILDAHPEFHLPPEERAKLVRASEPNENANPQIKNKSEAKKTDIPSSQTKRETDKREDANGRPQVKTQKNKGPVDSKVAPDASLSDDGLAESVSLESGVTKDGPSTIIKKASSSVSKSVNEVQSVAVFAAPFQLQQIISVSKVPGEVGSYKIHSWSSKTSKLLEVVYPLTLRFPFEPNRETIQWPVTLTNNTNHYVGVWFKPANERLTRTTIMGPHSTFVVFVTMKMHEQPPQDKVKFEVLMIVVQSKDHLVKLESSIDGKLNVDSAFMAHAEKLQAEVCQAMLTAITCEPASCQIKSRPIKNMTLVRSVDVHPTKTWIVSGHEGGDISIWDYQKEKTIMALQVNKVPGKTSRRRHNIFQVIKETAVPHSVRSVKFIARKNWLVVGDGDGYVYVYGYADTELQEVKKFRAHHHKSVDSLAVHPTEPYLLSSSYFGGSIKLWDWNKDWAQIKKFDVDPTSAYEDGVRSVKFDPRDTGTFACVTFDDRVKVGNIKSSRLTTKLTGPFNADYFFPHSHAHLMVTLSSKSHSEIRDLETGKVVHTLGVSGRKLSHVAFHPTLQKLVTMLDDGTACLWDASTYRLEEMVHITDSKCHDLVFVTGANGLTRLVATFETMIAIVEVNFPKANTSEPTGSGNYG